MSRKIIFFVTVVFILFVVTACNSHDNQRVDNSKQVNDNYERIHNVETDNKSGTVENGDQYTTEELDNSDNTKVNVQELNVTDEYKDREIGASQELLEGKYLEAYISYENLFNETGESSYKVKMEEVADEWIDSAIQEAEGLLSDGQYEEALEVLASPDTKLNNPSEIQEEKDRIRSYSPTDLSTLTTFSEDINFWTFDDFSIDISNDSWTDWKTHWQDNTGRSGFTGIAFGVNSEGRIHETYGGNSIILEYYLNNEYNSLTGEFVLPEYIKNTTHSSTLTIYCDGIQRYTTEPLKKGAFPEEIYVDVTGVTVLRLEWKSPEYDDMDYEAAVLLNAMLKKN